MLATSPHNLAERVVGLERTVERLMTDYTQLQRQFKQSSRVDHGTQPGVSFWKRFTLRRAVHAGKPPVRENKRIVPHVGDAARTRSGQ
jgi:hypothetical protein